MEGRQWSDGGEAPRRADEPTTTIDGPTKIKKLLPSVKALKSQFESPAPAPEAPRRFKERSPPTGSSSRMASEPPPAERRQPPAVADPAPVGGQRASPSSAGAQRVSPSSAGAQRSAAGSPAARGAGTKKVYIPDDPVEAIYDKFGEVDERMLKPKITTLSWDPVSGGGQWVACFARPLTYVAIALI